MKKIILTTLNAKYIHSSFGLRYLYANMQSLKNNTKILEFNINQRPVEIAEKLLLEKPSIIGFGVYIWNCNQTLQLIKIIKKACPGIIIITGGPEVSFESEEQEIVSISDFCITGEADNQFRLLCENILSGNTPDKKIIHSKLPETFEINFPYDYYTQDDIKNRIIYVEASRGCPFSCEFCLSSIDIPVRQFETDKFLNEIQKLMERGCKQFKFVDRTFNLNLKFSSAILEFFLKNYSQGMFIHFEMIPDRLPDTLRNLIKQFPPGALQFEVGIQSFNPEVNKLISRRQNFEKIVENFNFLRKETSVHIHADLIAGLPGESLESFADGFNRLLKLNPQEIQVGILKRLRGTPVIRHDAEWDMRYNPDAPYEILSNKLLDFHTVQRISRFSRYWDLFANSGNFINTIKLTWQDTELAFEEFMKFSDWLYSKTAQRHAIALEKQRKLLSEYLLEVKYISNALVNEAVKQDELLHAKRAKASMIRKIELIKDDINSSESGPINKSIPTRQSKHVSFDNA